MARLSKDVQTALGDCSDCTKEDITRLLRRNYRPQTPCSLECQEGVLTADWREVIHSVVDGDHVYLPEPTGFGNSQLPSDLQRVLRDEVTNNQLKQWFS